MPPDPPSRHTRLHVRERAFARYYHPATMLFSPQLKILYATLILPSSQLLLLLLFHCPQAQQYGLPVYYSGFVIGTAPLCMTVTSPFIGYLVCT